MNNFYKYFYLGKMSLLFKLRQIQDTFNWLKKIDQHFETNALLLSKPLVESNKKAINISSLQDVEFKVFSQWGDDGIIQWLIQHLEIKDKVFLEFGVENYVESNTRFLLMNNNWSGLVMDGSEKNVKQIKSSYYYWKYDLTAKTAFVNCENINELISSHFPNKNVALLHIDIDGNDYWIWKTINVILPAIVIVEYNSVLGVDRAITIPYNKDFNRTAAHPSNMYFGSSLKALHILAKEKGYSFIGCNSAGNNAYFIRNDLVNDIVKEVSLGAGYVISKFRESLPLGEKYHVSDLQDRIELIRGLPVFNIVTNKLEKI